MMTPHTYYNDQVVRVGVRQFRTELSKWIERACAGQEVIITDRGKAVARLLPVEGRSTLERLIEEGLATPPRVPARGLTRPTIRPKGGTVTEILLEQRRERSY